MDPVISSGWVGGGGPGQSEKKIDGFFSSGYFTEVKWLISKKIIIFQGSRGVQHFPGGGGGPTFSRGGVRFFPGGGGWSNCLFPI